MPDPPTQNYANHSRRDTAGIVLSVVTIIAILILAAGFLRFGAMLLAVLLLGTQFKARIYALTVQDRVIRLEMQVRLERILPDDLREAARSLTRPQLIALRFASDAELPDLVQKVLAGELTTGDSIKRAVTNWQPDTLRV